MPNRSRSNNSSHIRGDSLLFNKIIPALLVLMGILMVALILFAIAVLAGIIHF